MHTSMLVEKSKKLNFIQKAADCLFSGSNIFNHILNINIRDISWFKMYYPA
jgi:hypothetical protein